MLRSCSLPRIPWSCCSNRLQGDGVLSLRRDELVYAPRVLGLAGPRLIVGGQSWATHHLRHAPICRPSVAPRIANAPAVPLVRLGSLPLDLFAGGWMRLSGITASETVLLCQSAPNVLKVKLR